MIRYDDDGDRQRIAAALGCVFYRADPVIARVEGERLLGGSIFSNYTGESLAITVASFSKNWLNRELLYATFAYPFIQLKCARLFSTIAETNTQSYRFNINLGFTEVARIPGVYRDGAAIVTCMQADTCRWLSPPRNEHEQHFQANTAAAAQADPAPADA